MSDLYLDDIYKRDCETKIDFTDPTNDNKNSYLSLTSIDTMEDSYLITIGLGIYKIIKKNI